MGQKRKAKSLIIYSKFQLQFILINIMVIAFASTGVLVFKSFSFLQRDIFMGNTSAQNAFLDLMSLQEKYVLIYLLCGFLLAVILSFAISLIVSHRLAGPIVRLSNFFKNISENPEADISEVAFRKGDFFTELPPVVNSALKSIKNKSGFTLIELMITSAILSILALGFASYMRSVAIQQRQNEVKANMQNLNSRVSTIVADSNSILNSAKAQISNSVSELGGDNSGNGFQGHN